MENEILLVWFFVLLAIFNLIAFRYWKVYMFMLIVVYTLLMNIFVTKQFDAFGFMITGWNALYGATFLLTDLLSEHHGKKTAYKAVMVGFITMILFVVCTQALLLFTPNDFDFSQDSLSTLFSVTPRILLWSMLAFLIAQHTDIFLYNKIKKITKNKYLFLRNNGSTLISQLIDTFIFTLVGLTTIWSIEWIIPAEIFWEVFLATYVIKVIISLIDTPFMYIAKYIKK